MRNNWREIEGNKVEIDLNVKGKTYKTVIDSKDFELVSKFPKWYGQIDNRSGKVYAMTTTYKTDKKGRKKQTPVMLHRVILGIENEKDFVGDHKNFNTLDNTRGNLVAKTNSRNSKRTNKDISKVKKHGKRWGVFFKGELVKGFETKKKAQIESVLFNMEQLPELAVYHDWEYLLEKHGGAVVKEGEQK
ncbi:hypothetical protein [Lentibacillus cibarius]|uniref:HNH nuclease domain-containing protein n=1 Tax=Lentibacillus cibarius TaxID=2583219 RepID=A0A5S3QMM8_9BACI|nr:hypothetical protein [Lentibacillus cibarius]TMN23160.1 hypothetical protein FFL34_14480 [Lentibacillus cibarius]